MTFKNYHQWKCYKKYITKARRERLIQIRDFVFVLKGWFPVSVELTADGFIDWSLASRLPRHGQGWDSSRATGKPAPPSFMYKTLDPGTRRFFLLCTSTTDVTAASTSPLLRSPDFSWSRMCYTRSGLRPDTSREIQAHVSYYMYIYIIYCGWLSDEIPRRISELFVSGERKHHKKKNCLPCL